MKKWCQFLILASAAVGCATMAGSAQLVDQRDEKLTFKSFVGEKPEWYDSAFENAAKEKCEKGYDVLEKSFKPSTLTVFENGWFYWVVRCKK